jgi:hypothetical protein
MSTVTAGRMINESRFDSRQMQEIFLYSIIDLTPCPFSFAYIVPTNPPKSNALRNIS